MGQRELECCVKGPIFHHLDFTRFWRPWFPNFLNEFIDRRIELCEHNVHMYYVLQSLGPANISMGLVQRWEMQKTSCRIMSFAKFFSC